MRDTLGDVGMIVAYQKSLVDTGLVHRGDEPISAGFCASKVGGLGFIGKARYLFVENMRVRVNDHYSHLQIIIN
jgi:hypothetical protein